MASSRNPLNALERDSAEDSISGANSGGSREEEEAGGGEGWFVLFGGEAAEMVGELQHTGVVFLGRAYEQLRAAGIPPGIESF